MTRLIFLLFFSVFSKTGLTQKRTPQIAITPFVRFDKYPQFSKVFNGPASIDYVNMQGASLGIDLAYKLPITKSVLLEPAIGYYAYTFDNMVKQNTRFGKSSGRDINIISPVYIPFFTNKYRYSTIMANIGFERFFNIKKNVRIAAGINWNNYYAVSEYYHLVYNPEGSKDYRKNNKRYFGHSFNVEISLLKKFKKMGISPSLILPVFDNWKTDEIFPEETNSGSRSKWLSGIGLGISFDYSLTKKR